MQPDPKLETTDLKATLSDGINWKSTLTVFNYIFSFDGPPKGKFHHV